LGRASAGRRVSRATSARVLASRLPGIGLALYALIAFPALAEPVGSASELLPRLVRAALERTRHEVRYDGRYIVIPYPGGDVPDDIGVCTDVVIRAYRGVGIDLQRDVHESMLTHPGAYPNRWGQAKPDPSIDHRRVPNLQALFALHGEALPVTQRGEDYAPGDLVTWVVSERLPHIGIVVDRRSEDGERPLIVHNIGRGPKLEDMLFSYPITGHYRYTGRRE